MNVIFCRKLCLEGSKILLNSEAKIAPESNKKRAKIDQKSMLEGLPPPESVLDRFWSDFGSILAAKLGPTWCQVAAKLGNKSDA